MAEGSFFANHPDLQEEVNAAREESRKKAKAIDADDLRARADQERAAYRRARPNGRDHEAASAPALNLTFTRASDLAGKPIPERPWRVPEWIPSRQVTLLSGNGGIGKSLIALQLQIAAEAGRPWLGLPVNPCRSMGFYAEDDDDELHRRLIAQCDLMGVDIAVLSRMLWRSTIMDEAELIEPDERGIVRPTAYFHAIERAAIETGTRLLVLDAATNFFGGDEIHRRQVNAYLRLLHRLALAIDGEVLLLAHPSLAGIASGSGLSGSTHWNNGVRSRLYLAGATDDNADPDERTLTNPSYG